MIWCEVAYQYCNFFLLSFWICSYVLSVGCFQGSTKIVLKLGQAPQPQKDNDKQAKLCTQVKHLLSSIMSEIASPICYITNKWSVIQQLTQALEALEDPEEYLKQFTQVMSLMWRWSTNIYWISFMVFLQPRRLELHFECLFSSISK